MNKFPPNDKPKNWVISKIKILNWVTIACLFIGIFWEIGVVIVGGDSKFDMFDFHTYQVQHILIGVCGMFLIFENIALLKYRKIDVVQTAKDLSELQEEMKKKK